ncbi:MAG: hypothetical protein KKE23_02230 [Nanoarchaeota archaeon]|nr:hypothetical protein [Nanoarchaeota archaeon]
MGKILNVKYQFDDGLVSKVFDGMNDFDKIHAAAMCMKDYSIKAMAHAAGVSEYSISNKRKRLFLKMVHEIKEHYKSGVRVPEDRIMALFNRCYVEGKISPSNSSEEIKDAYGKSYKPWKANTNMSMVGGERKCNSNLLDHVWLN